MKFKYGKLFLLGLGFFSVSLVWATYNVFTPLFLANKFNLNPAWIGFFMTLDNIAAFFIQPPVGAWSDKLRTPIGRRMPFILVGAPIAAVAFSIIPVAAILPVFVACTSTLLLSMALWRTPVVALMPDITPSPFRSQANGIINLMGGLGSIIATLGGSVLFKMNQAYPFWVGSTLMIVAVVILFIFVKEPKDYEVSKQKSASLWDALKEEFRAKEKSPLMILSAIFFWFVAYNAIEAFFTLFAQNHLGLEGSDGARLLGHLSVIFVLFALPAGYIGARFGRRKTIMLGIILMGLLMLSMYVFPVETLTTSIGKLPALGQMYTISILLMLAGASWALININSLPMVVDMTDNSKVGTYTGLYYLFSTLAAIAGPNINGQIIYWTGNNYGLVMVIGPIFMFIALLMMLGVRRGEAQAKKDKAVEAVSASV
jgi:maltose/moltooligosaccharide transporter